ncbi:hypothetical protein ALC62_04894 [Cyphomyrmex costatus]|uniref:Uncharacterized protein n=1 Tax=Cyphomyrmex costatus TaxID=456900 RepID=A0A195CVD9_9HYME|nr:hypothetical protein ALC62_04894 [Cyphomyrmex costatus]
MPNPRRRGRQRENVGGTGGYFTDTQKTVVTICIGTLILALDVSSCSSGPDCSVPFDRVASATNAPFSMLVFESTRTNRFLLRAASLYELFVELIVVVVVVVVIVVKYNPPVLVDVALTSRLEEASIGEVARSDSLSDSSETSHPFLPRLLCLYTRLLGGTSVNPCHSLEGITSASSMMMLDRVEESSRLLDISLCPSSAILGIISSVRVPAASLMSLIESAVCSSGRSTVDSESWIVDTVRRSFDKGYGERQAVRTCRGADMTTGIQRRKSGATTLTKSAEWIT